MAEVKEQFGTGNSWLITFADLLSLLLTFFVLLFSMSTVQIDSWKAVVDTMSKQFNQDRPKVELQVSETVSQNTQTRTAGLNLNYLRVLMERAVSGHAAFDGARVYRRQDKVIISFPGERMFEHLDTELALGADQPLRQLAGTLAQIRNGLRIESNAGASPVVSERYRSRWELAMARGRVIAGILTEFGYSRSIVVVGRVERRLTAVSAEALAAGPTIDIVISADDTQDHIYDML